MSHCTRPAVPGSALPLALACDHVWRWVSWQCAIEHSVRCGRLSRDDGGHGAYASGEGSAEACGKPSPANVVFRSLALFLRFREKRSGLLQRCEISGTSSSKESKEDSPGSEEQQEVMKRPAAKPKPKPKQQKKGEDPDLTILGASKGNRRDGDEDDEEPEEPKTGKRRRTSSKAEAKQKKVKDKQGTREKGEGRSRRGKKQADVEGSDPASESDAGNDVSEAMLLEAMELAERAEATACKDAYAPEVGPKRMSVHNTKQCESRQVLGEAGGEAIVEVWLKCDPAACLCCQVNPPEGHITA